LILGYEPLTLGSELESELATILVLDEEADSCTLLKRVLQRMGHKVFAFRNSKEASEWVASHVPDLGIINVRQRHNEGFLIFGRLKEVNHEMKVMVITDAFPDKLPDKWFADEFLIKPLDIDQVEKKVRRLLVPERPESDNSWQGV
jgi:DNA-binding NtrC family response regulator